jgi:mannose-6-phosphate isomerase class I
MLTYRQVAPGSLLVEPVDGCFKVPVSEFAVLHKALSEGEKAQVSVERDGILIVTEGKGTVAGEPFEAGHIYYVQSGKEIIEICSLADDTQIFMAFQP